MSQYNLVLFSAVDHDEIRVSTLVVYFLMISLFRAISIDSVGDSS